MGLFLAMFFCNLFIPLIMVIAGYLMYKKPPKNINGFIGYRTSMSTKSKETWSFAHNYCGRLWIKVGAVLLILSIIAQLPFCKSDEDTINLVTIILEAIQLITILLSIVPVEKALKRSFDKNGNKKQ